MSLFQNNFDGGTDGTTITAANSGGTSGTAFNVATGSGTSSRTYVASGAIHGSLAAHITAAATESQLLGYDGLFSASNFAFRFYITFNADTSADGASIFQMRNESGAIANVNMFTGRSLRAGYAASSTLTGATYTVVLGTTYRIEGYLVPGASATSGRFKYALYTGESTTPLASGDQSNVDLGSAPITRVRFGKTGVEGSVDYVIDSLVVQDNATDFIGPVSGSNIAPTANAGTDQTAIDAWSTVTLSGTDSDSDGTVVARTWRQVSGSPAVTLSGSGATRTYQAPGTLAGTTLVFGYTVTDNGGLNSVEDTVTHTILAANERAVVGGVEVPMRIDEV